VTRPPAVPTISVALCTHNGANFIREQLASILAQTLPPTDIVLSDDASTDNTVELARAALAAHPQISLTVLSNQPALGVMRNFQQAALASTGELIALCDQDDLWDPTKLQRIAEVFAARDDVSLVHTDAQLVSHDGEMLQHTLLESLEARASEIREIHDGKAFDTLLRRNLVTGATAVLRRSLLDSAVPFADEWVHDEWLAIVSAAVATNELIDEPLIDYRQHASNQIGARKLTFRQKLSKFREPRQERNEHLVARALQLVERLEALGPAVKPEALRRARQKLAFERARLALPAANVLRLWPITRAALDGRYRRFSLGLPDVVRDLAQPAR